MTEIISQLFIRRLQLMILILELLPDIDSCRMHFLLYLSRMRFLLCLSRMRFLLTIISLCFLFDIFRFLFSPFALRFYFLLFLIYFFCFLIDFFGFLRQRFRLSFLFFESFFFLSIGVVNFRRGLVGRSILFYWWYFCEMIILERNFRYFLWLFLTIPWTTTSCSLSCCSSG